MKNISYLRENSPLHTQLLKAFQALGAESDNLFSFKYSKENLALVLSEDYQKSCKTLLDNGLTSTELVLLNCDGGQDGHAVRLGERTVTFLDLVAYINYLKVSNFDRYSHLLHEMIHGAHYAVNEGVSPLGLLGIEDSLGAKSIVEGVCVYIARKLSPERDNYWFNYLSSNDLLEWEHNCSSHLESDIKSIKSNEYTAEQVSNLLGCTSFEVKDLILGRRSYYCVSTMLEVSGVDIDKLLIMTIDDVKDMI